MNNLPQLFFEALTNINERPELFSNYTAKVLWDDDHISKNMLAFHLDEESEPASRPHKFIDESATWIVDRFSLGRGMRVADIGCGPGLYTSRFAKAGATVTGVDFSRRSIAHAQGYARDHGLSIDYVLSDYLEFRADNQCDLVTLIYCDFCVLRPEKRKELLNVVRNTLSDEGSLLLDVFSLHAFQGRDETTQFERNLMGGFWSANDYWGFSNTFKYEEAKVVVDKYSIIEPDRSWEVFNWLQYYSLETLTHELEQSGFEVIEHHADVAGSEFVDTSDAIAVVARKA